MSTSRRFDRSTRQMSDELNEDQFVKAFTKAAVKNWKGLSIENLTNLILVDTEGADMETELEFSLDNAEFLIRNCQEFDLWVNEVVYDLERFRDE